MDPPVSDGISVRYEIEHSEDLLKFHKITREIDEDGNHIITYEFETGKEFSYSCFNPPKGTEFMFTGITETSGVQELTFTVTAEQARNSGGVTFKIYDDAGRSFAFYKF